MRWCWLSVMPSDINLMEEGLFAPRTHRLARVVKQTGDRDRLHR